ncbi:hypothetical protein [Vitiosangium sp. GDMCC 1.1324]|uniref:hypothetical protein n=1 Tax=Vitiosangium sp. (strain GDMCC 1.1324) TaxID=2138576 RepID=UPI000D3BCDC1|nr:hypothetical protein [Vitiosangium sp. GDMCC 1.1324]PTL78081.1 hypothetical protein DAT35_41440 [Vitiosangium sp. GDMCC 1.1324]
MSLEVSDEAFEENLHRYFEAEGLPRGEVRRLHDEWQRFAADERRVAEQEALFRVGASKVSWRFKREPMPPAFGLAWWEERWDACPGRLVHGVPITALDRVNMLLSTDSGLQPCPAPRPYRPDWLPGTWRCSALYLDGRTPTQPESEHEWTLHPDGRVEVVGSDPYRIAGSTWRVHLSFPGNELWFEWPAALARARTRVIVLEHQDDELDLLLPDQGIHQSSRWRRV